MAARLPSFLHRSVFDREPIHSVKKGRLRDLEIVEQQVWRMLRAKWVTAGQLVVFFGQLLRFD